jgi:hypothetical protein
MNAKPCRTLAICSHNWAMPGGSARGGRVVVVGAGPSHPRTENALDEA